MSLLRERRSRIGLKRIRDGRICNRCPFRLLEHSRKHHYSNSLAAGQDSCSLDVGADLLFVFKSLPFQIEIQFKPVVRLVFSFQLSPTSRESVRIFVRRFSILIHQPYRPPGQR